MSERFQVTYGGETRKKVFLLRVFYQDFYLISPIIRSISFHGRISILQDSSEYERPIMGYSNKSIITQETNYPRTVEANGRTHVVVSNFVAVFSS